MTERRRYQAGVIVSAAVTAVAFLYIFYLGQTFGPIYYRGVLLLLPLAAVIGFYYQRMKLAKMLEELRQQWGQPVKKDRDPQSLARAYSLFPIQGEGRFSLSSQTWEDLHMDRIYALFDRTITSVGEQVLYNTLRTPLLNQEPVLQRMDYLRLLETDNTLREKLQAALLRLGRQEPDTLTHLLWGENASAKDLGLVPNLLAAAAVLTLIAVPFWGLPAFVFGVLPVFAVNTYYQNFLARHLSFWFPAVRYLRSMLVTAEQIGSIRHADISGLANPLKREAAEGKGIIRKARMLGLSNIDAFGLYEYANIFFLLDTRNYYGVIREVRENQDSLRNAYLLLGEVDTLIAIASLRAGRDDWVEPHYLSNQTAVFVEDACHPLLDHPVPNSIALERPGAILTGSNMSGKSTFLRTIGVNALLAQTVCLSFCRSYHGSLFKIVTTINKEDQLPEGKSYFLMEAEAILHMLQDAGERAPALCIIDEIFRGTHSLERIPAAIEVLIYLAGQNAVSLIATHDLDVARACDAQYPLYHFRERVGDSGLEFDYLLKEGITTSWNAIKILRHLGFPRELTEGAQARINREE